MTQKKLQGHALQDLVERILDAPRVNRELKSKLRYCRDELARGRDAEDENILRQTRDRLVADAQKAYGGL